MLFAKNKVLQEQQQQQQNNKEKTRTVLFKPLIVLPRDLEEEIQRCN